MAKLEFLINKNLPIPQRTHAKRPIFLLLTSEILRALMQWVPSITLILYEYNI